ncbi:hypothetical protein LPUS_08075 [Lasallia pustulata]|uniref:Uncharacterized protein n=1 Tax=Lasallia pustulata TaxID=136370 RepID=A0A1W5D532_9LECA|nr:hypothetical protein LPUS_08075 [Lasallia pustulata]
MIDTDYYYPILLNKYLVQSTVGRSRVGAFLAKEAGSINPANLNLTYGNLTEINAAKIMRLAAPFAAKGGQKQSNLVHLKSDQIVGQWRDSTYGIGGGRVPFDQS